MSKEKKPARPAIENELQRLCRAAESIDRSLKHLVLIQAKSLSGSVFRNFDAEAELEAKQLREKQKEKKQAK